MEICVEMVELESHPTYLGVTYFYKILHGSFIPLLAVLKDPTSIIDLF